MEEHIVLLPTKQCQHPEGSENRLFSEKSTESVTTFNTRTYTIIITHANYSSDPNLMFLLNFLELNSTNQQFANLQSL